MGPLAERSALCESLVSFLEEAALTFTLSLPLASGTETGALSPNRVKQSDRTLLQSSFLVARETSLPAPCLLPSNSQASFLLVPGVLGKHFLSVRCVDLRTTPPPSAFILFTHQGRVSLDAATCFLAFGILCCFYLVAF